MKTLFFAEGVEISSYAQGIGFALTNPTHTSPKGFEWKRAWSPTQKSWREYLKDGIMVDGRRYLDVEDAYQKLKHHTPIGPKRNDFLLRLIEIKLETYPDLMEIIEKRGGKEWILECTHFPNRKGYWETGGRNMFIKLLAKAYENVSKRK